MVEDQENLPTLKEPKWPMVVGTAVPLLVCSGMSYSVLGLIGWTGVLWGLAISGGLLSSYSFLSYLTNFLMLLGVARRPLSQTARMTYSFVSWKCSGFMIAFAACLLGFFSGLTFLGAFNGWLLVGLSALVAMLAGIFVIEIPYGVDITKRKVWVMLGTEAITIGMGIALYHMLLRSLHWY